MHLNLHNTVVNAQNSFFYDGGPKVRYIFDILLLINHSCASSHFSGFDKICFSICVRPIKKGDQVFINYLLNDVDLTESRQKSLKKLWGFDCKCDKCEVSTPSFNLNAMKEDPLFNEIRNYQKQEINDNKKRFKLKQQCISFLKKYGSQWSPELDIVINCFISIITKKIDNFE